MGSKKDCDTSREETVTCHDTFDLAPPTPPPIVKLAAALAPITETSLETNSDLIGVPIAVSW